MMIQFYFLSVLLNGLVGYLLVNEKEPALPSIEAGLGFSLKNETVRLVLGIMTALTGVLKLLSPVPGDLVVIGDLIPACAGLAGGFSLVFEYYRSRAGLESERMDRLEGFLTRHKKKIGYIALVSAALHFLFPPVLLL
jgi:hypothetical protein